MTDADRVPRFPVAPVALRASPDFVVARVGLGLTFYLDDPLVWAREAAPAVLQAFLERAPAGSVRWFTSSLREDWVRVEGELPELVATLSLPWSRTRPRHLLQVRFADDPGAPSVGFAYREVDDARSPRAGVLELVLPFDHDPNELLQLALEVGHRWPFLSAVGGYTAAWCPAEKLTAFWRIFAWCRRYHGLDVQDPDAMAWHARRWLPGTNWLTLLGSSLARAMELDPGYLLVRRWERDVTVMPLAHGALVRAGAAPTLGDLNTLAYPSAYAEVARQLAPWVVPDAPELPGRFDEEKATARWRKRFVCPEGWT